jgi:hypothetical protein
MDKSMWSILRITIFTVIILTCYISLRSCMTPPVKVRQIEEWKGGGNR